LLLNRSIVDWLNLCNSCEDKTSPNCPFPETDWIGGAGKSGIGDQEPRVIAEILGDKVVVGCLLPATARKTRKD